MFILKFHCTSEIDDIKISKSLANIKKHIKEQCKGVYRSVTYKEIGQFIFIYGNGHEIGVIGEIDEI
jgi:hypothetical protein